MIYFLDNPSTIEYYGEVLDATRPDKMQTQYASFVKPVKLTTEEDDRNREIETHALTDAAFGVYSGLKYHGADREWYRYSYRRVAPLPTPTNRKRGKRNA